MSTDCLLLKLNLQIYASAAIIRTAYKFSSHCYIQLNKTDEQTFTVQLKSKCNPTIPLTQIADDFGNELIDQQIRITTEKDFGDIRNAIIKQAFAPISNNH